MVKYTMMVAKTSLIAELHTHWQEKPVKVAILPQNTHQRWQASLLPASDPQQVCRSQLLRDSPPVHARDPRTGLMSPLRIGHPHEQDFPRDGQTREGVTQPSRGAHQKMITRSDGSVARTRQIAIRKSGTTLELTASLIPILDLPEVTTPYPLGGSLVEPVFEQESTRNKGIQRVRPLRGPDPLRDHHPQIMELINMTKHTHSPNPHNPGLPPLPDRAIRGLSSPWPIPMDQPFHTVSLWEFTNLYVLLGKKDWELLARFLEGENLSHVSHQLKISTRVLESIRDNYEQSIVVPNLYNLCKLAGMNHESVEQSIRGVRFNQRGSIEQLTFPFVMDLYAWRTLCHIAGDGNVTKRKYPALRWIQNAENQGPMRTLLHRLSRTCGGENDQIWYPKALSYAMLGSMLGMTFKDIRTPKFIQFIIDLPPAYREWKIQFLAAFIIDDGCVSRDISFYQKDKTILQKIIRLCDQLGYDHSPLYRQKRDGVHNLQLRQEGIQSFYNEIYELSSRDPLLGLWHKHNKLEAVASSFSLTRGYDIRYSNQVCITIFHVLDDHCVHDTDELRNHPKLKLLLTGYPEYWFNRRLQRLAKKGLILEVLQPTNKPYRPKRWRIPPHKNAETLIKEFHEINNHIRNHSQSYKRKFLTTAMIEQAIVELDNEGIKPTAQAVAQKIGCSKKQLYGRDDFRRYFMNGKEEFS